MSDRVQLVLYVAGASAKSERAKKNLADLVDASFGETAEVEVIDLLERPQLARERQIVAVPSLVREQPEPRATIVGDLSDRAAVLEGLGIIS